MVEKRDAPAFRERGLTVAQRGPHSELGSRREVERLMAKLGAMPRILCWNCRKLTPFEVDRCEHCGSPFAGATGGAYRSGTLPRSRTSPRGPSRPDSKRSISQIVEDIQHIHEIGGSLTRADTDDEESAPLYQCPSCSRFVSSHATDCVCGVRFAMAPVESFACPECECRVPLDADVCPVCRVGFESGEGSAEGTYACARCGVHVTADAVRCGCGAWFED